MKSFTTKLIRVAELTGVIDAIQPKDLGTLKDIRLASNLVKDLQESSKPYFEKLTELQLQQMNVVKKYQEQFKTETEGKTDEEKKAVEVKLNAEMEAELKAFNASKEEETKAFEELGLSVVSVELGDEKFAKLTELFERFAADKYTQKTAYLEVAEALGL